MGYGRTPKTVERTRPLLDEMVKSDKSLEWIFDDPQYVAYKIWEAIHYSVKSRKKEFEDYTTLLNKFTIKVIPPDVLKAEIKKAQKLNPNGMIIREVTDVLEVIGTAIEYNAKKMVFPDIKELSKPDIAILSIWCENNGYIFDDSHKQLELVKFS